MKWQYQSNPLKFVYFLVVQGDRPIASHVFHSDDMNTMDYV